MFHGDLGFDLAEKDVIIIMFKDAIRLNRGEVNQVNLAIICILYLMYF